MEGYPRVLWNRKVKSARRLLVELSAGKVLHKNKFVYAICGEKTCMSEAHLKVGTRKTIITLADENGRVMRGLARSVRIMAGLPPRKIPDSERHAVEKLRAEGWSYARIGAKYGTTKSTVGKTLRTWQKFSGMTPGAPDS